MSILSFLKPKDTSPASVLPIKTDIHSHLIPAIDDGVQSIEESLTVLREMEALGYEKVITTPHSMPGTYDNSPENIYAGLEVMREAIKKEGINIQLEAATEYYLDESFVELIDSGAPLMTFGNKHVLFETPFMNMPPQLKEVTFKLSLKGYKPVFAHPERYLYLMQSEYLLDELIDRNVILQLNIIALTGCYSKPVQKFAEKLIDMKAVKLVGTDCHNMGHIDLLKEAVKTKYFKKLMDLDLLNNSL
ncbi:tyrosine-protein phosphatase [Roseivirga echinicomitans]|uniref:protein-tyrosine-phosphatase n=1 Tax=Roseivirga echinicomitans TaxID=296218 RepID=A0A150XVA5_9BACT|nr:CpsB/CapC family capsule biosynthesis tyrosine phosphatase [Roseivirga echinicomitans]KYG82562.1 capsular biosynthesis protein [Roseivirga echinicomitans]